MLPKDPAMLLSVVNTALRDTYPSLAEYAAAEGVDEHEIIAALQQIDYAYDETLNKFV